MKLYLAILLVTLLPAAAQAASNVRFKQIDTFANTVVLKNYGDATEVIHSWILSSRGMNLGVTGDLRVNTTSGSTVLAAGAEVELTILNNPDFLGRRTDDLALHRVGSLTDPAAMVDYVVWGGSGGFRESVAVAAGIWNSGDHIELGEVLNYTGDGSDTGPRVGHWTVRQTNVRLLSVDPIRNRFSIKNFDTHAIDIREWLFTIGSFSLSVAGNPDLSVPTGITVLNPGDELTFQVNNVLVIPAGSAIGVYRSDTAIFAKGGMSDFVQWITNTAIREPVANMTGIWTIDAALDAADSYTYDGDGTETGPREAWWNTGGVLPVTPTIEATLTFTPSGQPRIDFTSVSGRIYDIKVSSDLAVWQTAETVAASAASTTTWIDFGAGGAKRRFYKVVDITP